MPKWLRHEQNPKNGETPWTWATVLPLKLYRGDKNHELKDLFSWGYFWDSVEERGLEPDTDIDKIIPWDA